MMFFPLTDFQVRAGEMRLTLPKGDAQEIYDLTIDTIDRSRVRAMQDKYRDHLIEFDPNGIYKYADLPYWVARNVELARRLKLDMAPPLRILDIGMGAGHFAAVAQALGHRVVGTDIPVPLYDDIALALDLDRRIAPVVARQPYPPLDGPFDRIMIIWQVFDYIRSYPDGSRDYWPVADWEFLLRDLAVNHALPEGIIHLELNCHYQGSDVFYDQDLLGFCVKHGGDVSQSDLGIVDLPVAGLR